MSDPSSSQAAFLTWLNTEVPVNIRERAIKITEVLSARDGLLAGRSKAPSRMEARNKWIAEKLDTVEKRKVLIAAVAKANQLRTTVTTHLKKGDLFPILVNPLDRETHRDAHGFAGFVKVNADRLEGGENTLKHTFPSAALQALAMQFAMIDALKSCQDGASGLTLRNVEALKSSVHLPIAQLVDAYREHEDEHLRASRSFAEEAHYSNGVIVVDSIMSTTRPMADSGRAAAEGGEAESAK